MPEWSIKIEPVNPKHPAGSAQFVPPGGKAGEPLKAWDGDLAACRT